VCDSDARTSPEKGPVEADVTLPVDFWKGHDGLAALVQSVLKEDPFTAVIFVFRAKRADRLRISLCPACW
jgi:transposase